MTHMRPYCQAGKLLHLILLRYGSGPAVGVGASFRGTVRNFVRGWA
jgi:hypothetical protein